MTDAVQTMDGIAASSAKVGEIIAVIDGIAFQTNILALNAAVEAARAGEQGAASRSSRQRCARAAQRVRREGDQGAHRAIDAARRSGRGADRPRGRLDPRDRRRGRARDHDRRRDLVGIAEQSAGIQQVNVAVAQMDEATQRNAALVEQASAATQALAEQANALRRAVAVFRLPQAA
jgi:methyl-accepting chemotaxis protein-1 (serine sensor receptor)